jgi:hypothetical protein
MSQPCWSGWRAAWQAHSENRAFARLARHGHITAHHARELAGDGKPEPGAAEALSGRGIGLGEFFEQLPASTVPPTSASRAFMLGFGESRIDLLV